MTTPQLIALLLTLRESLLDATGVRNIVAVFLRVIWERLQSFDGCFHCRGRDHPIRQHALSCLRRDEELAVQELQVTLCKRSDIFTRRRRFLAAPASAAGLLRRRVVFRARVRFR